MKKSLLILPFLNLSSTGDDDYLSDGITEELIATLSNYEDIEIASRASSFYFKQKDYSLEEIASKLKVTHILEGSMRRLREQLRIVVHLTKVEDGLTLWSETFNLKYDALLSFQAEITQRIVKKIIPASGSRVPLQHVPNNDNEAYKYYLKGIYYFNKYSMDNMANAINWFKKAINLQPGFAQAHAAVSTCYLALGGFIHPSHHKQAKAHALEAIAINDNFIEPHLSLAFIQIYYDWDWKQAEKSIQKALEINIRSAIAHRVKGLFFRATGQIQNGIHAHEVATKYDPLNTIFVNGLGWMFAAGKRFEEANKEYERCLEIDPDFRPAVEGMGWVKAYEGKFEEAIQFFTKYQKMTGHPLKGWYGLGYTYGKMGAIEKAYEILGLLDKRQQANPDETLDLDYAIVYLGLNELEKSFYYLNRGINKYHLITVASILVDPVYDELKQDPRYLAIIKKLRLEQYFENSYKKLPTSKVLQISGETNEQLIVRADQLFYVKSDGNYTRFFWKDGQKILDRLIRIPISKASAQIDEPYIIQSHRSYLINLHHFNHLVREGRTYFLENEVFNITVPVARGRSEAIAEKIKELFEKK